MEFLIGIAIVYLLLPYVLVVAMPRWYFVLAVAVFIWGIVGYHLYRLHLWARAHNGDIGWGWIDQGLLWGTAAFVSAAVVARLLTFLLASRGWSNGARAAVLIVGFFVVPGWVLGDDRWRAWQQRGPDAECAAAVHTIDLGKARLRLGAMPAVSVYLGSSFDTAHYFEIPSSIRLFCRATANGATTIRASALSIKLHTRGANLSRRCETNKLPQAVCKQLIAEQERLLSGFGGVETMVALDIARSPHPGGFGGSHSTYADSRRPSTDRYKFVISSSWRTADGNPWAARCFEVSDKSSYYCETSFPWRDGLHLVLGYRTMLEDAEKRAVDVEGRIRRLFDELAADRT